MTAFKVAINGATVATAAEPEDALLIFNVMAGRRGARDPSARGAQRSEGFVDLWLSAVTEAEHLWWLQGRPLQPGDVVTLTVLDDASGEPPRVRNPKDGRPG